ncbi:MAG: hypothetical protein IPO26_13755 [Saprospiraceae bacterium]|nr:hypothetical protein [Saprospiraceae bacterium]
MEKGELESLLDKMAEGEVILKKNHKIGEPVHLFTRIDDEVISNQMSPAADWQNGQCIK